MKSPISTLNELVQKKRIAPYEIEFTYEGAGHKIEYSCTVSLPDYGSASATDSTKSGAKTKACDQLLVRIEGQIDIEAKVNIKGAKPNQSPGVEKRKKATGQNDVSYLFECHQGKKIPKPLFDFSLVKSRPQKIFECACSVGDQITRSQGTSKQQAKIDAAKLMREKLPNFKDEIKKPTPFREASDVDIVKNELSQLNEIKSLGQITDINYFFTTLSQGRNPSFSCKCHADDFVSEAQSTSKKDAKLKAAKAMIGVLSNAGIITEKPAKSPPHKVEQNACEQWIRSICPNEVHIRTISWYLLNNCVLIQLGGNKQNPPEQLDALRAQIEDSTGLDVLIKEKRNTQQAIDLLTPLADKRGYICNSDKVQRLSIGKFYKKTHQNEPIIDWIGRTDHTKDTCFTIDSKKSLDLDDAFSVTLLDDECIDVFVHIADVSFLVTPDSKEDNQAKERCFSYYGATGSIPMLSQSTTYQSSLLPEKNRMTWTIQMSLDNQARLVDYSIYQSVVASSFRMTQQDVDHIISDDTSPEYTTFDKMRAISDKLMAKRLDRGGVNELPDENIGYRLVQEYMLLANQCVASFCAENEIPIPYRMHKFPDGDIDIKKLYNEHKEHGVLMPFLGKASYHPIPRRHEALAFDYYCHFTSPIRRYADLTVQRQLAKYFDDQPLDTLDTMQAQINQINQCEEQMQSVQTSMSYLGRLQVQFKKTGSIIDGIIEDITVDGQFIIKPISKSMDFKLRLKETDSKKLGIGKTVQCIQLPEYHVQDEVFECTLAC